MLYWPKYDKNAPKYKQKCILKLNCYIDIKIKKICKNKKASGSALICDKYVKITLLNRPNNSKNAQKSNKIAKIS